MAEDVHYTGRTVDITPSWTGILPVLIGVLQNPKAPITAHREAEAELQRMAKLADQYVAHYRATNEYASTSGGSPTLSPRLGDPDQKES